MTPTPCAEHGYSFDLGQAKQALADAGLTDSDGNGFVDQDGQDLVVTLWSYSGSRAADGDGIMQADFNAMGLKT